MISDCLIIFNSSHSLLFFRVSKSFRIFCRNKNKERWKEKEEEKKRMERSTYKINLEAWIILLSSEFYSTIFFFPFSTCIMSMSIIFGVCKEVE